MIYKFFTIWVFVLILFHTFTSKFLSLPFLSFIVLFKGLYFSYINPTKYLIINENSTIVIDGYKKIIVDLIFHILPFIFICYNYGLEPVFNNWKLIPSLLLANLYLLLYNPCEIYHVNINEIAILTVSSFISYLIVFNIYKKMIL